MITRIFRMAWSFNPMTIALVTLVLGIVLFLASVVFHMEFVSFNLPGDPVPKEVGFLPAVNWSIGLIILFPAALFSMLITVQRLERTLGTLPGHHMLAQEDWKPATTSQVSGFIDRIWRSAAAIGLFFFIVGVGAMAWDWWSVVGHPLSKCSDIPPILPGAVDVRYELDWSISSLFKHISSDELPTCTQNKIFSAAAYAMMAVESAAVLSFYGILIGVASEIYALSDQRRGLLLTPNVTDKDRRRGFQVFAPFFGGVLTTTLLGYLACYFMRIQNLYMREVKFHRIDEMLLQPIADSATSFAHLPDTPQKVVSYIANSVSDIATALFDSGRFDDINSYEGALILLIVIFVVAASLVAVLRAAAQESRTTLHLALSEKANRKKIEGYYGVSHEVIARRIGGSQMDVWPLHWPTLNSFVAFLSLGFACFIFYRLGLIWIAVQMWRWLRHHPGAERHNR